MSIDRRSFLQKTALSATALSAGPVLSPSFTKAWARAKDPIETTASAIAKTAYGRVQGFVRNGIYVYKGIPYGANPTGANRFAPPLKPTPWTDVRTALAFGRVSPHGPRAGWANDQEAFLMQWSDGISDEDCLNLNVWTPAVNDGKKRPVMVWIHGGGYASGSSQELPAYDGENISRQGDVVLVSMNHRLNVFGFLNLSEYGSKYAQSANVGMLDLVAALEWIRDNITNFGGDPGNVFIFGQSGGGGKVSTLLNMPAAKGLFHKAAVHSGSLNMFATPENSKKIAAGVLAELGLTAAQVDQLHTIPTERLMAAGSAAIRKLTTANPAAPTIAFRIGAYNWMPTVDGKTLPTSPFNTKASDLSAQVPLIIGSVLNELSPTMAVPGPDESMTLDDVKKRLTPITKDRTASVIDAYRKVYPQAKPVELYSIIMSAGMRDDGIIQANHKAAQGTAPAYVYFFTWQTPVLNGTPRAFHCAELPFVFNNIDRCENATGGGEEARTLATKMSQAWINFARTSNPNHKGLPNWPPYTPQNGATMYFDKVNVVKNDPDKQARQLLIRPNSI